MGICHTEDYILKTYLMINFAIETEFGKYLMYRMK